MARVSESLLLVVVVLICGFVSVGAASAQGPFIPEEVSVGVRLVEALVGAGLPGRGAVAALEEGAAEEGTGLTEARAVRARRYQRPVVQNNYNNAFEFSPQISLPSTPTLHGQSDRNSAVSAGSNTTLTPAQDEFLQSVYEDGSSNEGISSAGRVAPNEVYASEETKMLSREQMSFLRSVYK
jgi:hypothetical protein